MPRLLLFRVGLALYGLDIEVIQEVADDPPLSAIPQGGRHLLGAVNLHGRVLPVIDLPALLDMAPAPRDPRLVVLGAEYHGLALAVSGIGRIAAFEAIAPRPPTAEERMKAVAGVIMAGDREDSVNLLDADAVIERLETLYAV